MALLSAIVNTVSEEELSGLVGVVVDGFSIGRSGFMQAVICIW